jgi:purine-nucleoside phosphorylase
MTPHNRAEKGDFAKTVLMPGDPLRAKWLAETFLENARLVTDVRGMLGFTGSYHKKPVSVMGHGMGIPSMGIYSWELYQFYGVDTIIRIGSAGSYSPSIHIGDVVIAKESFSFSCYADDIGVSAPQHTLQATPTLVAKAEKLANALDIKTQTCRVFSEDSFYYKYTLAENVARSGGAAMCEMESFALYANALYAHRNALALLTCSDSIAADETPLSPEARQTSFTTMTRLALALAVEDK